VEAGMMKIVLSMEAGLAD